MGSSGSKGCCNESTMAASSKTGRSRGNRVFQSSCLGTTSGSHQSHNGNQNKENGGNRSEAEPDELKMECDRKVEDGVPRISSHDQLGEWGEASITSTTGSSSARSSSTPSRYLSRFSLIPGNISCRLSRATTLGSSRTYTGEQDLRLGSGTTSNNFFDRTEARHGNSRQCHQDSSSGFLDNLQKNQTISSVQNAARDGGSNRVGVNGNVHSPRILNELENMGTRVSDRRIGVREPVERNVRFSRTLSVGRLRDRVLRRSSLSDITFCPLQQEREVRDASQSSGRNAFGGDATMPTPERNVDTLTRTSGYQPSSMSSSLFSIQDQDVETSRSRASRYHDLLEHRSNFLERRRRIRSQVRALQRLGSRFENLSGHERSCILSGQHRTGRCTCRVSNRDANSSDDTGTRTSISRIVMLAEALFEVLDEIHQQSVVLSTQPSVSSLGSIPAPNEVVESLPVKFYTKSQKYQNEEAAQCYICLVEYEEGDSVRILPCHHEFHRTCVDKWLKEIHRVCPLCRGDICKSDSLPSEN